MNFAEIDASETLYTQVFLLFCYAKGKKRKSEREWNVKKLKGSA
jgi:mannose/cellobiose epimerase-like protein (N-acyl-D-glucosamine 2-epimerase family)